MAFLQRTYRLFRSIFGCPPTLQATESHHTSATSIDNEGTTDETKQDREHANDYKNLTSQSPQSKKRKQLDVEDNGAQKKARTDRGTELRTCGQVQSNQRGLHEAGRYVSQKDSDRELMPPPGLTSSQKKRVKRESVDNMDCDSDATSLSAQSTNPYRTSSPHLNTSDAELPQSTGTWEPAEKELWEHLSLRGKQPLLPTSWMIDFPTLPLSLFATNDNGRPLVELHRSSDFRAVKALSDLVDTGKTVRDRAISTTTEVRSESTIERATNRYIKWALKDIGVSSKECIPVHAVVAMKPGHTTHETIRELTLKMHKLSARHRKECDVLTSIERDEREKSSDEHETRLRSSEPVSEHKLPIIYGLMICSSLIAVWTLDSHKPPPRFVARALQKSDWTPSKRRASVQDHNADEYDDEENEEDEDDLYPRHIATFDFSDSAADVWNAFVVLIVAMMVRKTLVDVYEIPMIDEDQEYEESILENSIVEGDLDVGTGRYLPRYAAGQLAGTGKLYGAMDGNIEDDPDL